MLGELSAAVSNDAAGTEGAALGDSPDWKQPMGALWGPQAWASASSQKALLVQMRFLVMYVCICLTCPLLGFAVV